MDSELIGTGKSASVQECGRRPGSQLSSNRALCEMRNEVLEIQCSASSNSRPLLRRMRLWTARLRLNQRRTNDSVAGLIVFSRLLNRLWDWSQHPRRAIVRMCNDPRCRRRKTSQLSILHQWTQEPCRVSRTPRGGLPPESQWSRSGSSSRRPPHRPVEATRVRFDRPHDAR